MSQKPANDWLLPTGSPQPEADEFLLESYIHLRPRDVEHMLWSIREFEGTKVMLSCTDQTPLENVLKLALCLADLVIVVPAPLWTSCVDPKPAPYVEFNWESSGRGGLWSTSISVLEKVSGLIVRDRELFVEGAVTFLPVLGRSMHRWSHPDLGLPELPRPYSEHPLNHTNLDIHMEALYGLFSERMASEAIGAIHLNSSSFVSPVVGDFVVGRRAGAERWKRELIEISMPDVTQLPQSEVLRLRRELRDDFSQFSGEINNILRSGVQSSQPKGREVERLRRAASNAGSQLARKLSSKTSEKGDQLRMRTLMLGMGEPRGGLLPSLEFLKEGCGFRDFIDLITCASDDRLMVRDNSLLNPHDLSPGART